MQLVHTLGVLIASAVLTLGTLAQDGPPYPDDYPFGADGNADHPNGYDGYPGDHPDNPIAPHGGPGGDGWGTGNGGFGGDAAPGGNGGDGGKSGPDGGTGGDGGDGGDNPDEGFGGNGGNGGNGEDGGGDGGDGGDGENGGPGGHGGNAHGPNGEGGDGGDGGKASDGLGGRGGNGGAAPGDGGCGGDGGDGGDAVVEFGGNGVPGGPGDPGGGRGDTLTGGDPCHGDQGDRGRATRRERMGLMPTPLSMIPQLPAIEDMPDDQTDLIMKKISGWIGYDGPDIRIAARYSSFSAFPDLSGQEVLAEYRLMLHPESLEADTLRVVIESRPFGDEPEIIIGFGVDGDIAPVVSPPVDLGDGWVRRHYTIARPVPGEPIGKHLDMLTYSARHVEVRGFRVLDMGKKGDVNADGRVDGADLGVVLNHYSRSGGVDLEEGDTNGDGEVDAADVSNVVGNLDAD